MFMISAAVLLALVTGTGVSIEGRTLAPRGAKPEGVNLVLNERIVTGGGFVSRSHVVGLDGSIGFSQSEYKMDGTPVCISQEGFWSDRWNHFETRYGKQGTEQQINEQTTKADMPNSKFRNPTLLWFWKTQPKPNESVTVTSLAQNVIRTSQIEYTYEGDEEMTLAGRKVRVHRVREVPLPGEGVYTIWWYDDQGMGVRRYHKTPENEYTDELVAWH
jgi:hypothetical protein